MIKLIIGLGNPGSGYDKTRHNVGFMALDYIAAACKQKFKQVRFRSTYFSYIEGETKYFFIQPLTFMNLSGVAVNAWQKYFQVPSHDIIVIHDDLDLPLGTIRIKQGGSSAGHKGIKNISQSLKTTNFVRMRIGIGRPLNPEMTVDYVLQSFSRAEHKQLTKVFEQIWAALQFWCFEEHSLAQTMSRFNHNFNESDS